MKSIWIAIAAAGVIGSGTAIAGTTHAATEQASAVLVPVQYSDRYAAANERMSQIDERESRINARIQRGMQEGRITEREARRLNRDMRDIEAKQQRFMSDGYLSRFEVAELNRDLDRLADNVRQQMRDEDRRY